MDPGVRTQLDQLARELDVAYRTVGRQASDAPGPERAFSALDDINDCLGQVLKTTDLDRALLQERLMEIERRLDGLMDGLTYRRKPENVTTPEVGGPS
jgi:hypothetical protein